ncbi:High osmolarity signaling protein sho1 [Dissostichus eleginoides]|uniref:High osmolarity signaling protein sho1 n=1 Tax=Dissostichus eleginoides TaxID=100907 RepID=A0AAD9F0Z3_DISEL|nr:High osmolarity signaling protein sho1 [Dissostichus eleginoides]
MMTFQVNASLLPTANKALTSDRGSSCSHPGLEAPCPAYRSSEREVENIRRKLPLIQPLSRSRDWNTWSGGFMVGGSPHSVREDNDITGRHFLFEKQCVQPERTRTVVPPLQRGSLHPFSLSKEPSHSRGGRPFTLGYAPRYDLTSSPAHVFPSSLILSGRNSFSVESCKLSRPKVNYPTYSLLNSKDNQKSPSYPDPVLGASRSFFHRISELSSLEGETVRQEKLKKMRKLKKPPS